MSTQPRSVPEVGDALPVWRVESVSAEKMKTMAALLADPNPIHFDTAAVAQLGMGDKPINQGPLNMAYVMNMLSDWAGGHQALRRFRVRFVGTVVAEDALVSGGTVTGVSPDEGGHLVDADVYLRREDGADVLRGTATVLLAE
ncbi:MAG: MaoC family dehydratase [Actinomycetales bacterium]